MTVNCDLQNVVVVITSLLSWLIPDVPAVLKEQIRREAYITNEIVLKTELRRAHGEAITDRFLSSLVDTDSLRYSPHHSESPGPSEDVEITHRRGSGEPKTYV